MATLATPEKLQELQRALYQRAKQQPRFRFYALYDKVYRRMSRARLPLAKANAALQGPTGEPRRDRGGGRAALLRNCSEELKTKRTSRASAAGVHPEGERKERPLGIPNIRDRVVQTAAKLR